MVGNTVAVLVGVNVGVKVAVAVGVFVNVGAGVDVGALVTLIVRLTAVVSQKYLLWDEQSCKSCRQWSLPPSSILRLPFRLKKPASRHC